MSVMKLFYLSISLSKKPKHFQDEKPNFNSITKIDVFILLLKDFWGKLDCGMGT